MSDDASLDYRERVRQGRQDDALREILERSRARREQFQQDGEGGGFFSRAGNVLRDVGRGAVEAPLQIAGGALDAINETIDLTDDAATWLEENVASLGGVQITDPETGEFDFEFLGPEELKAHREKGGTGVREPLPTTGEPESVTGGVVRGIAQFVTGFIGAGKGLKALGVGKAATTGGRIVKAAGQGAVADFAVFDPAEARLSNLIESVPALKNPVTEFLAADEDDTALEGRLKNTVEGLGAGLAVDGFVTALRGLRNIRHARSAARAEGAPVRPPEPELSKSDLKVLGDPDGPALQRAARASEEAAGRAADPGAAKIGAAEGATKLPVPEDIAATGLAKTAARFRAAVKALRSDAPVTLEDIGRQAADEADSVDLRFVDDIIDLVREVQKPPPKIRTLTQAIIDRGGLKNQSGEVSHIIGNARGRPGLINNKSGMTLDEAGELLSGDGWFPELGPDVRATIDDVLTALRDDIDGTAPRVHPDDLNAQIFLEERRALQQSLDELGIDANVRGEAALREHVENALRGQTRPGAEPVIRTGEDVAAEAAERQARRLEGLTLAARSDLGGEELYVNFARIDTADDVRSVIGQMADAFKPEIDAGRRGARRGFEAVKLEAEQLDAWETLASRRKGAALNDAETVAARNLWAASGVKLQEVAAAAAKNPSEANLFAFRKMLAVHHAIQMEVIAARTEAARALNAWKIPAGGDAERLRQVTALLEQAGGADGTRELAQRIQHLDPKKFSKELDAVVRGSVFARSRDALLAAWVNGLLSGPKTHLVNMMSNTAVMFHAVAERAAGARLSQLLGTVDGVELGEATAQAFGMVQGLRDAFRNAWKAARTGQTGFGIGKVDLPRPRAIGSEAFGLRTESWLGKTADAAGNVIGLPGRALQAEDEFFKTLGYRMEVHAQALRMASREARAGKIAAKDVKRRAAEIAANPPESVRLGAVDAAAYQTFTRASKLGKTVGRFTSNHPTLRFVLPFVNTPINLFSYTLERTPLAPLMQEFRGAMAKGGADADLALTKMATGTAVMLATADLAMSGRISGGGPQEARRRQTMERTGWQPYSVKVGDRWYSYRRFDPLGSLLGISADMVDILVNSDPSDVSDEDVMEAWTATVAAIASNTMSKTWMTGPAEFFEMMSDPKRYGETFFSRFAGSFVPAIAGEVTRQADPNIRAAASVLDGMKRRVPILSKGLPAVRDLWGRERRYQSGLGTVYDMLSPVYSRVEDPEPVDRELLRLDAAVSMPTKSFSVDGVDISLRNRPEAYWRYVELAGNGAKHPAWKLGAKDFLNAVIEGRHPLSAVYGKMNDGPDGGKADFIAKWITDYRKLAKRQLLREFPELNDRVQQARRERLQAAGAGDVQLGGLP